MIGKDERDEGGVASGGHFRVEPRKKMKKLLFLFSLAFMRNEATFKGLFEMCIRVGWSELL